VAGPALSAGRVGRPHGLDGSFYVTAARPRLLRVGSPIAVGGTSTRVLARRGTDQRPILRVEGIRDRDGAAAVRGSELTVAATDAPALQEGEWWAGELEGCEVVDGARRVGEVARLIELPSCEALEVRTGGEPLMIPLVRDAIRSVDVAAGRIDVDMGFLEG
jgi:16S rRNA processing protein RimM